ncbi:MAG: hypothetical protein Q8R37_03140 [Nanoarchaeota archaeon]|nr:hypothetical protein [Nanoarchaeota archaeon]
MANIPATKRVYTYVDLDSLVAGDRVKLDYGSEYYDGAYLAVYEGRVGERRIFLSIDHDDRMTAIVREVIHNENISFDQTGDLVVDGLDEDEGQGYYEIDTPERRECLKTELKLLQQAGLYHG